MPGLGRLPLRFPLPWLLLVSLGWASLPGGVLAQYSEGIEGNRVLKGTLNACIDQGSTDDYACNLDPAIAQYREGFLAFVKANTANTGAATLNLNGRGVTPLRKAVGGVTTPLVTNDIRAGQWMLVLYDATQTQFQLLSTLANLPSALAANGTNCGAGQAAQGTDASGNAEGCFAVTTTIASGATALATAAIASGTCATPQTVAATGVASTDAIIASFNANITSVTGYTAATTGTLRVDVYPTTNNVNLVVCNNTAGSITPGAVTLNWRVVR